MELERRDSRPNELAKTASALFGPDPFSVSEKIARTPEPVIEPEAGDYSCGISWCNR